MNLAPYYSRNGTWIPAKLAPRPVTTEEPIVYPQQVTGLAVVLEDQSAMTWQEAWDSQDEALLKSWFINNTGPKVPLTKTFSGTYQVNTTTAAANLSGTTVTGQVEISIPNVTVRDFKVINPGGSWGLINVTAGGTANVVIEDAELDGAGLLTPGSGLGGVSYARVTARRLNIHDCIDGVRAVESGVYENLYIHNPVVNPSYSGNSAQHADGVQWVRQGVNDPRSTVTKSWIDHTPVGPNVTSALMFSSDTDEGIHGVTVTYCYLNGASYTVQIPKNSPYPMSDIIISDNRFGRGYTTGLWSNGVDSANLAYVTRERNVWVDTLEPVPTTWGAL